MKMFVFVCVCHLYDLSPHTVFLWCVYVCVFFIALDPKEAVLSC